MKLKNVKGLFLKYRIIPTIIVSFFLLSFVVLFQQEFLIGNNQGTVKIVASSRKNEDFVATDAVIKDIIVNGDKRTNFSENQWEAEDNAHLIDQSYYANGNDKVLKIISRGPMTSLSFISQSMPTGGIIQVYLDDKLYAEIDLFSRELSLTTNTYIFPGRVMISSLNLVWYMVLAILALASYIFIYKKVYRTISKREWATVIVLAVCSLFVVEWSLSKHQLGYFQFWNSVFGKQAVLLLIPTLITLMFVFFKAMQELVNDYKKMALLNKFILGLTYLLVPISAYYILENSYSSYLNVESGYSMYNIVAYSVLFLCLSWVFSSMKKAGVLILVLALLLGTGTSVLLWTRNEPFLPYHLYQLTTGLNVAARTQIVFSSKVLQSLLLTIIFSGFLLLNPEELDVIGQFIKRRKLARKWNWTIRALSTAVAISFTIFVLPNMLLSFSQQTEFDLDKQRMESTYAKKGFFLAFTHYYMSSKLQAPEGYSEQRVEQILSRYPAIAPTSNRFPNIIMIQNESQAYYSRLTNLQFSSDPMEFQHSLSENTIAGENYVSVFGGGTSNTEYEVLTSNAMAGLPLNIFPFQELVNTKSDSLVWTLSHYGYDTVAMHPETKVNYRRELVYKYLGFDSQYFNDSDPSLSQISDVSHERGFVSDQSVYSGVRHLLENKTSDAPLFNFVVTMQGHGSYTKSVEEYDRTVTVNGLDMQNDSATEYLTSLRSSDQALKELLTFLKDYPEPTIVVMYGDHHPTLSKEFFGNYLDQSDPSSLYKTPLLIWGNFKLPERSHVSLSANYLVPYLFNLLTETDHALPISPYYQYMYQLYQEVPVQTTWGYYLSEGQFVKEPQNVPLFEEYKYVLYNHLKDRQIFINYYQ